MGHILDSFLEWNTVIVGLTGVTIYGVVSNLVRRIIKKQNDQDEFMKHLKQASLATLHNEVYKSGKRYIERKEITVEELDNFGYLFKAYKGLGGNGTGDAINDRVNDLPIVSGRFDDIEQVSHFVGTDKKGNYIRTDN